MQLHNRMHSALEQQYCLQEMHFWKPTPASNIYFGEHFDQVAAKSTGQLWFYPGFTFYNGNQPKYLRLWPFGIFFCAKNPTKTERQKYNTAKVANILVSFHCKK